MVQEILGDDMCSIDFWRVKSFCLSCNCQITYMYLEFLTSEQTCYEYFLDQMMDYLIKFNFQIS